MKNIRKCESLKGGQIQHKIKNQQVFTNQQKPNEEIIVDKRSQFIMQKKMRVNLVKGLGSLVRKNYRIVLRDKEGNLFKWKDIPRF